MMTTWKICGSRLILLGAFIALGLVSAGCGGDSSPKKREKLNLIVLSVDTLRYDHLHFAGYERETSPRLDEFARESIHFANTFAPRGQTWPALTSVMTGLYPISHGVRHNGEMLRKDIPSLAGILRSQGYETGAFLTNFGEAPNRGFQTKGSYQDKDKPHHLWDDEAATQAINWLEERRDESPFFMWLHLVSPHADYEPPEPYDTMFSTGYKGDVTGSKEDHMDAWVLGKKQPTQEEIDHIISLYDGEVAFSDAVIGRVIDEVKRMGLWENSVVVFLSDHGEELMDHKNYMYHGCSIYDAVLKVPFLLRLPEDHLGGTKFDGVVSLVDVLPTVLHVLDSPVPHRVEGVNLIDVVENRSAPQEAVMSEWARAQGNPRLGEDPGVIKVPGKAAKRIYAIRTSQYKYIYNPANMSPKNHPFQKQKRPAKGLPYELKELYDIKADPGETRNIASENREVSQQFEQQIKLWIDGDAREPAKSDAPDDIAKEALKALGYIDVPEGDEDDDDAEKKSSEEKNK